MNWVRMKQCACTYLREVSAHNLRVLCVAVSLAMVYAMWSCQLGPAVIELQSAQRELKSRLAHPGANDKFRTQLRNVQEEVRTLRAEISKTYHPGDRANDVNRSYSYIESTARRTGLRIRLFETTKQGFIQPASQGFSKVLLEGAFPDVVKFSEALTEMPSLLRLDTFVASIGEETPETISLSLTLSDVMLAPNDFPSCDVNF